MTHSDHNFIASLKALPRDYSTGHYDNRKYGLTIKYGSHDRQAWLYAEELGGNNHISCNIYFLRSGEVKLKPCEMSAQKVIDFISDFKVTI